MHNDVLLKPWPRPAGEHHVVTTRVKCMKGGLTVFSLIKPLSRWHRNLSVRVVALLVLALVPGALAADSLEFLRVFQKNKMPSKQKIRQSYTNFTYKSYERQELSFNILIKVFYVIGQTGSWGLVCQSFLVE